MSLKAALVAACAADATANDLLAGRVFPLGKVRRGAGFPRMTYQTITADRVSTLAKMRAGPVTAWVQLDFWAEVQADADAAAAAVLAVLDAANEARLLGELAIRSVRCDGDRDDYESYGEGADGGVFRVGFDAHICYCEG